MEMDGPKQPSYFLSPVGPPVVVPFLYSSYAEQHSNELMTLFDVIKKSGMQTPILLGDFNHGPARTGMQ